jgi:hypothetical protein
MKKQNGIVKIEPSGKLMDRPEHLRREANQPRLGSENVTPNDVIIPRLGICQSASFERKKSHAKFIEGLDEGMYFNTVTKEIYGREIHVVPVHFFKSRVRWAETIGEPLRCKSEDAMIGIGDPGGKCLSCPQAQRDGDCTLFMNFPLLVVRKDGSINLADILVYPMKSIAIGAAKHWNSLDNIRNGNRFDGIYKLTTVEDHRDSGDSFQPHVENSEINGGWTSPEMTETGRLAYEMIQSWRAAGRLSVVEPESETVAV